MELPETREDIQRKFIDAQVQESLYLDYKDSRALTDRKARSEIAKDVSAFANSDGGMIIYGVEEGRDENKYLPIKVDDGVDHRKFSREWLENVITSNIAPRINDVQISQIPITDTHSIFAIKVPKSFRGPHQERLESNRYYRRFNYKSVAMEDYEIREAFNRRLIIPPLINIDLKIKGGLIEFVLSNVGNTFAQNVEFETPSDMLWDEEAGKPGILKTGIRFFPAGRKFYLLYNSFYQLQKEDMDSAMQFEIGVSYFHPELNQLISEKFPFDLREFPDTVQNESDIEVLTKKIVGELKNLVNEIKSIEKRLEPLSTLVTSTGLQLSVPTIENLRHIANQDGDIEKLDPRSCSKQVFVELLGVTREIAWNFADYFGGRGEVESITQIEGVTEGQLERFKRHFLWVEVPKPPPHKLFSVQIEPLKKAKR